MLIQSVTVNYRDTVMIRKTTYSIDHKRQPGEKPCNKCGKPCNILVLLFHEFRCVPRHNGYTNLTRKPPP